MLCAQPNVLCLQAGSLKSLTWLLGFRISLLVYYATRVLLTEIDRAQHRPSVEASEEAAGSTAAREGAQAGAADTDTPSAGGEATSTSTCSNNTKCALCMDAMTSPAAIPCGHVFCWACILAHARAAAGTAGGTAGRLVKCPMCRAEFRSQRIRALFGYG